VLQSGNPKQSPTSAIQLSPAQAMKKAILISIGFHLLLLAISVIYKLNPQIAEKALWIELEFKTSDLSVKSPVEPPRAVTSAAARAAILSPFAEQVQAKETVPVPTEPQTESDWSSLFMDSLRILQFRPLQTFSDSLPVMPKIQPYLPPAGYGPPLGRNTSLTDAIKRELNGPSSAAEPVVPLSRIVESGLQLVAGQKSDSPKPPELDFIPSMVQIQALKLLWETDSLSGRDIYSALDPATRTTARDLEQELELLVNKQLLQRQMISPRNELTLGIPFAAPTVEMSGKNRRNREYRYQPLLQKQELLEFLNALVYRKQQGLPSDIQLTAETVETLQTRVLLLTGDL